MDLMNVCGLDTEFQNGKCVSTVDATSDNASMCDTPGVEFQNGKCVSTVDVTSDNAYVCGRHTVFSDGKCVSNVVCPTNYRLEENGTCFGPLSIRASRKCNDDDVDEYNCNYGT